MATKYRQEQRDAQAELKAAGSALVFTPKPVKKFSMATGHPETKQSGSYVAYGIEKQINILQGNDNANQKQGGVQRKLRRWLVEALSLETAGYVPEPGHYIQTAAGVTYAIAKVTALAPDGAPILYTIEGEA
jgi:hypothetical protein